MNYEIDKITKNDTKRDDGLEVTYFDILLKNPVNGIGSMSIPAKTKKEAIKILEENLVSNNSNY